MAFLFRRSIKIAPGLRLNFGKRGVSASAGPRGATINVSQAGVRATTSLPGTGLSYSEKLTSRAPAQSTVGSGDLPTGQAAALLAIGLGTVAMLTRVPSAVAVGWVTVFLSLVALLKGWGWIVRLGGSFVLSLAAMAAVLAWAAQ
jgi:Protein of unknown function (DUF4236)